MNTGLKDKAILITGASQGMGRSTAEAFAAEGARVAICARKAETISAAGEAIRAKYKTDVIAEAVDVTVTVDGVSATAAGAYTYNAPSTPPNPPPTRTGTPNTSPT